MSKMRAKLTIESVEKYGADSEVIRFRAKYDPQNSPEDNSYSKYTPCADATFTITNPALVGTFKAGETFYVDFTPVLADAVMPKPPRPTVGPESGTITKGA